ncbi:MAG: alpha/beta hydrolase [Candidatus Phosphoribacter sp.]|nr:alpha/beta hydrolase [Actinomycetales bacterium]
MSRIPLRTRLFAALLEHGPYPQIQQMDIADIEAARSRVAPLTRPFTWVTGPLPPTVKISDAWAPMRDGSRRQLRTYRPDGAGPHPVVVFFHGGGWVLGSPRQYDPLCGQLAQRAQVLVVSVDYRMGPEHRAPQAAHDAIDATSWIAEHAASLRGDPSRLGVCGDSAGGNLAALVTHAAYDAGGPAIAHQALIYPATDLSRSFPSIQEHAFAPVLTKAKMDAFIDHYLGAHPRDLRDPALSPYWRADLSGLPPALVQTADNDPIRDEGLAYGARLAEAGVAVRRTNYLGAVHGFLSFPGATHIGRQALSELVTEVRRHLHPPVPAAAPELV